MNIIDPQKTIQHKIQLKLAELNCRHTQRDRARERERHKEEEVQECRLVGNFFFQNYDHTSFKSISNDIMRNDNNKGI